MALSIKEGYVNPLTMMGQKKNGLLGNNHMGQQTKETKNVKNLQMQRQTLQNQILIMKGTSDSAGVSQETQKVLEQQLEDVSVELKSAKTEELSAVNAGVSTADMSDMRKRFDSYERGEAHKKNPMLYEIQQDEEKEYKVLFSPYSE